MAPALLFYGFLAGAALLATIRNRDLLWIGVWLAIGFTVSNILHATLPVTTLPGPYSFIELMILLAASIAWDVQRRYWPLLILGGTNIISICANIAFATTFPPHPRHVFAFEVTTNICFALECFIAIGVGIWDGIRTGRFHRVPRHRRGVVAKNASSSSEAAGR